MVIEGTGATTSKLHWGELEEDDGELNFILPPRMVIGPKENGLKKLIDYKFNEDGNKVKITTMLSTCKLARARLSTSALELWAWSKFGDAAHEDANIRLTMVSIKEIVLERPRAPGSKVEEPKVAGDPLAAIRKAGDVLMVCKTCGKKGDHWTSKCPYKDLDQPSDTFINKPPVAEGLSGDIGKNTYVPPGMRASADRSGTEMRRRNDENSVRVTNLFEDTYEQDVHELFPTFGLVSCVYVAVDQKSGVSRGFGFENFIHREDAEKVIKKLNGYGYDNLILRVEWATPRPN